MAEVERRGHRAVAVDLPCDSPPATTLDNAEQVARAGVAGGATVAPGAGRAQAFSRFDLARAA